MHARHAASTALLLALHALPLAQEEAPPLRAGDAAPPLAVARSFGLPDDLDLSWEARRGEVCVIEFWATWCGPCIPALAHLADVQRELADEPVRFLGLSPEEPERMEAYLERHPAAFPILLDADDATFDAYGVHGIPRTAIVDAEGRVAALTKPDLVTADVLRRVLRGEPAGLEMETYVPMNLDWAPSTEGEGEVFARCVIAPSTATGAASRHLPGSGEFTGDGLYRDSLIQLAWDVPHSRLVNGFPAWRADDPRYRLSLLAPGGDDELARRILQAALEVKFDLEAALEEREADVYVLVADPAAFPESTAPQGDWTASASGGGIDMVGGKMEFVRAWFENLMQRPVLDDTGLLGRYDLTMNWVDRASLMEEIERVGLELVPDRVPVPFLVVGPRQ